MTLGRVCLSNRPPTHSNSINNHNNKIDDDDDDDAEDNRIEIIKPLNGWGNPHVQSSTAPVGWSCPSWTNIKCFHNSYFLVIKVVCIYCEYHSWRLPRGSPPCPTSCSTIVSSLVGVNASCPGVTDMNRVQVASFVVLGNWLYSPLFTSFPGTIHPSTACTVMKRGLCTLWSNGLIQQLSIVVRVPSVHYGTDVWQFSLDIT